MGVNHKKVNRYLEFVTERPNVGLEITKGVGKVVVQELYRILELVCS